MALNLNIYIYIYIYIYSDLYIAKTNITCKQQYTFKQQQAQATKYDKLLLRVQCPEQSVAIFKLLSVDAIN